jgi:hypothetical protein
MSNDLGKAIDNLSKALDRLYEVLPIEGKPISEETTERYKPIILQEHDAEPRTMRAILDTATDEIYICKLTRQGAEILGMTIEEVNADEDSD